METGRALSDGPERPQRTVQRPPWTCDSPHQRPSPVIHQNSDAMDMTGR